MQYILIISISLYPLLQDFPIYPYPYNFMNFLPLKTKQNNNRIKQNINKNHEVLSVTTLEYGSFLGISLIYKRHSFEENGLSLTQQQWKPILG